MSSEAFIEIEIADEPRFLLLETAWNALAAAKRSDDLRDEAYWLPFFDEAARAHFSRDEGWTLASMLESFEQGDYALLGCRRIGPTVARLDFEPHAWPYGGTACMRTLVEAFGQRVLRDESP